MRNKTLTALIIILLAFGSQGFAQLKIGGGLAYGTEIENIGINVNGQYFLNDNWALAPGLTYFLPKEIAEDYKYKWFDFNANAHYYFDVNSSNIAPYALGGLNFAFVSVDFPEFFGVDSSSSTEVGLNLGGGVNFMADTDLQPYAELRYVLGDADQLVIGGGIRFVLN